MAHSSDAKTEFKRRLRAQIVEALRTVNFNDYPIQPGLHMRHLSPVSVSWSDRVNTLQRVELMQKILQSDDDGVERTAA